MILLRHGETMFNVIYGASRRDPGLADPGLTAWGRAQAGRMADALRARTVRRLVCSPYLRALETAAIIRESLGLPVVVDARVRERCAFSCDVGTPRSALAADWTGFAFERFDEIWWPSGEESEAAFLDRCRGFGRAATRNADWRETAVVTHWGVIRALTGRRVANGEVVRFDSVPDAAMLAGPGD